MAYVVSLYVCFGFNYLKGTPWAYAAFEILDLSGEILGNDNNI